LLAKGESSSYNPFSRLEISETLEILYHGVKLAKAFAQTLRKHRDENLIGKVDHFVENTAECSFLKQAQAPKAIERL
jgi:hypothetical protein